MTAAAGSGSRPYRALRALTRAWAERRLDLRAGGLANLPASGPALLACNHPSAIDGALLFALLPRRMAGMLTAEALPLPWLRGRGALFGFPVLPRRGDGPAGRAQQLAAMAAAADALARGWLLVVPPEGDVTPGRRVAPFASAFVYLAARARAPIVPTALVGSDAALRDPTRPGWLDKLWPRPARVEISFLPPIALDALPDRATADALGERVRATVQREVDRLTGLSAASAPPD